MIYLKSESEIDKMRESAQIVSRTLGKIAGQIEPGVSTAKLDRIAEEYIDSQGGTPAFKGYGPKNNPFPATLCISINDEVVHGIPSEQRTLSEGDIVSIDCGVEKNGYFGDHAYTFAVGQCSEDVLKLLRVTLESLNKGIEKAVHGNRVGDISNAVQTYCEEKGYGVVRDLVGHGIGKSMHEDPSVPTMGSHKVKTLEDGWTVKTADKSLAAHYEHDVVIREGKAEVLSTFDYINEIEKNRIKV